MAEESENNQSSTGIEYAGKRKWGYDVDQVDDFLERAHEMYDRNDGELTQQDIQSAAFTFTKGGYVIAEVDAALARLEHAVVDKETARQIVGNGNVAWQARTQQLYSMISSHAKRSHKDRFMRGEKKRPSYDVKQVDRLVDQIITKTADDLGVRSMSSEEAKDLADLNSSTVANVIFTQRKGSKGYDERQVDYYLDACVQLLSRVESYARITDYNEKNVAAGAAAPSGAPVAAPVTVPVVPETQSTAALNNGSVSPLIDSNDTTSFVDPTIPTSQSQTAQTTATATFDFNSTASNTDAPVIPNLPEGVAAATSTAAPAQTNASSADANSSLAALANMANATSTSSEPETEAFVPKVPTLNTSLQGTAGADNSGDQKIGE